MKTNRSKMLGLALVLALVAAALAPLPAHAWGCNPHNVYDDFWTFYSSSTFTTVVGQCENDCGSCTCRGSQTAYYTVYTTMCQ